MLKTSVIIQKISCYNLFLIKSKYYTKKIRDLTFEKPASRFLFMLAGFSDSFNMLFLRLFGPNPLFGFVKDLLYILFGIFRDPGNRALIIFNNIAGLFDDTVLHGKPSLGVPVLI